ncbi:MAG: response regulator [Terriglobia bacterium]
MRVLIVDDEKDTLRVMERFLDTAELEILPVGESVEAARQITTRPFDAMIIDVHMPAPDGLELTRLTRRSFINRRTPIVLITGYDDLETRRKASDAGATCFAGKPVTQEKIRNIVQLLLGSVPSGQRNRIRLPFRTQVNCRWSCSGAQSLLAESLDLGQCGMLLKPPGGLTVGQEMELDFSVPSLGRPLLIHAKAVRLEPPDRIGVQFLDSPDQDYKAVQSYIAQQIQR